MALGQEWDIPDELFNTIQAFTCSMYSANTKTTSVNKLRYEMFRSKQGDVSSGQLPPCQDALLQHTKRANYQTAIWRRSLCNSPDIPQATAHGWVQSDGKLVISWITGAPAPEVVLSLMCCKCSRSCTAEKCTCIQNGLSCTPACKLQNCENMQEIDEDDDLTQDDDDSENDED